MSIEYNISLGYGNQCDFIPLLKWYDIFQDDFIKLINDRIIDSLKIEHFLEDKLHQDLFLKTILSIDTNPNQHYYLENNNRIFEWKLEDSIVTLIKICKNVDNKFEYFIFDNISKTNTISKKFNTKYIGRCNYQFTDIELINLIKYFDVVELDFLLLLKEQLTDNFLDNKEYNKIFYDILYKNRFTLYGYELSMSNNNVDFSSKINDEYVEELIVSLNSDIIIDWRKCV